MAFWTRDELRKGRLYWLLDFEWGGVTYRFTDEQNGLDVTIGSESYRYNCGLEWSGELADEVDPFSDAPEPRSASLTLWFPPGVDVPERVARGFLLGCSTGRLMQWCSGTTRVATIIDGDVRDPEYETKDDPVTCSLEEIPFLETALWPPATAKIDSVTWTGVPGASEKAQGEFYPWILGTPGLDSGEDALMGSPGYHLDGSGITDFLLIAGHPVEATQVRVRNYNDDSQDDFLITEQADGRGRIISRVNLNSPIGAGVTIDPEHPYWIRWDLATGGGLAKQSGSGTMRGAGDQIWWWLQRSSLRWDRGRMAAVRDRLNSYLIDSAATANPDSRIGPYNWIQEHLLPILPLSPRVGPDGLYFAWFNWTATLADADSARFDADAGFVQRSSHVSYSSRDSVANEFRFSYRVDAERNKPIATYVLTGDQETLDAESSAIPNLNCKVSRTLYGRRVREFSSDVVYDVATAGKVCQWMAAAFALQSREVVYTVPPDFGHLAPGDVVAVTDSEVGLSDAVGLVERIPWRAGEDLDVLVRLLPAPGRDHQEGV